MENIFNIKNMEKEIIEYAYWLIDEEGRILQIYNEDYLHDILLLSCGFENYILDNDELYEEFCAKVQKVNINKLNKTIKNLMEMK